MTTPTPDTRCPDSPAHAQAREAAPDELGPLVLADRDIPYPHSPAWQQLGATVRREATQRRRRARTLRFLAVAATLALTAAVAVLLARSAAEAARSAQVATVQDGAIGAPTTTATAGAGTGTDARPDEWQGIQALATQFELDYLALELARAGIVEPGDAAAVDRILEKHDIDAVEVYLAARKAL